MDRSASGTARRSVGAPALVLVPTRLELEGLARAGAFAGARVAAEVCGFGPVAAAAHAARRVAVLAPRWVLLAGIAGTFDPGAAPVGSARRFAAVTLEGVGAGEGHAHRSQRALGFADPERPDPLPLARAGAREPLLLTVCAAARDEPTAARRRARGALAEDMEAYGVALACFAAGIPCGVVRGLSNEVGAPRSAWRVEAALAAAAGEVGAWLAEEA